MIEHSTDEFNEAMVSVDIVKLMLEEEANNLMRLWKWRLFKVA